MTLDLYTKRWHDAKEKKQKKELETQRKLKFDSLKDKYENKITAITENCKKEVSSLNQIIKKTEKQTNSNKSVAPSDKLILELTTVKQSRDYLLSEISAWEQKFLKMRENSAEKKREAKYLLEMTHENWKTDIADCHGKYESLL